MVKKEFTALDNNRLFIALLNDKHVPTKSKQMFAAQVLSVVENHLPSSEETYRKMASKK